MSVLGYAAGLAGQRTLHPLVNPLSVPLSHAFILTGTMPLNQITHSSQIGYLLTHDS